MHFALDTPFGFVSGQVLFGRTRRTVQRAAMPIAAASEGLCTLDRGATLVVAQPANATADCLYGIVWITHDGDPKDVIISAGHSYASERASRMLVHAVEAATVSVR
jgi:hypothetical protein